MTPAAELLGVSKALGGIRVLDGVSLELRGGETLALLGPSGAGKSTVLRLLAGLERPDAGVVRIAGRDAAHLPPHLRGVGLAPQQGGLYGHLSVAGNLAFGLRTRGWKEPAIAARVGELLAAVGLERFAERFPDQLSGGERQRVAFARALAAKPALLLLDEPFAGLDPPVRRELRALLRGLYDLRAAATLLVTHDHDDAFATADRIALLDAGRIVQIGSPDDLRQRPATPFVRRFLGLDA